jgi:hypothetical protein
MDRTKEWWCMKNLFNEKWIHPELISSISKSKHTEKDLADKKEAKDLPASIH